jgi:ABC-type Na+ transport system ATPase subunit NatA
MLSVRDLVKVYPGPVTALQGVQLDLSPGMFGLLGPNGAGKSTFMRILAGLLEPTSGTVTLDGVDIIARPEAVRAKLGYLPQEFGFYPHLTGEQMLLHLLRLKGVTAPGGINNLARELLERVNLSFAAKRRVKGYSGGMRQRLGIAQAIAGNPRLVIVDEPTAGLDPEERLRFYRLLGLDIPAEADEQPFVIHRMGSGVSLFFDTVFARTFDPDHRLPEGAGYSSLFEFYLGDDAGVDARYAELVAAGYHGRMAPAQTQGPYAAMVDDPDGHVILLTSDEAGLG